MLSITEGACYITLLAYDIIQINVCIMAEGRYSLTQLRKQSFLDCTVRVHTIARKNGTW